ncbi:MAG: PASTA domain-containing protein [Rikenellaceae bacterium]
MSENNNIDWWSKRPQDKQGNDHDDEQYYQDDQYDDEGYDYDEDEYYEEENSKENVMKFLKLTAKHCALIVVAIVLATLLAHFGMSIVTRNGSERAIPDFTYVSLDNAKRMAHRENFELIVNDSLYSSHHEGGLVMDQMPASGTMVKPGRKVYLTINALQRRMVDMPYVAGRSLRQAKNMLEISGFTIEELIYRQDLASNYVLAQYCNEELITASSNVVAPYGSGVTLHVGLGSNRMTTVPDLIGMSIYEAKSAIWESGLNVGTIERDGDITVENQKLAKVKAQRVDAEKYLALGTKLGFSLTLDIALVDSLIVVKDEKRLLEQKWQARAQYRKDSTERAQRTQSQASNESRYKDSGFKDLF